jgi:hypothetical protein
MLELLRRERRRLRRKYIKKIAARDYYILDRWLDAEYLVAGIPVWVAAFLCMVDDRAPAAALFISALLISVPWWAFITVIIIQVYARWGDKYYTAVTRRKLSKEYRR